MSIPALGVIFLPNFPPETLMDYARRAENAGFDELWLWDDCFLPGALTAAAIALSATNTIKVGIGLLPATAYHPLFAAMEITTLARAFPGRVLPGFGHGVDAWMTQIGAAPKSSMKALEETVVTIRRLLAGEMVTFHGEQLHLDKIQMAMTPVRMPPLYLGAMRKRTLRLAGKVGDGTILTGMSAPAYVRWAREHIAAGMTEAGRTEHRVVCYLNVKVNPNGESARAAMRRSFATWWPWADVQLKAAGLAEEVAAFIQTRGSEAIASRMPDEWLDAFSAAGTPEQAANGVQRLAEANVDTIIFQPLNGDPACLDEYIQYLMPLLKSR